MKTSLNTALLIALIGINVAHSQGLAVRGAAPPDVPPVEGKPLETREPNATNQRPAFAVQTRAAAVITKSAYKTTIVADKLFHPWSITFMPDGRMLITEKKGTLRMVSQQGFVSEPLRGMPNVLYTVDAGLLDLKTDPDFKDNRTFYFSYVEPTQNGSGVCVASAILPENDLEAQNVKVIFRVEPDEPVPAHYGSRLLFDEEGKLFVTTGEYRRSHWLRTSVKSCASTRMARPRREIPSLPTAKTPRRKYGLTECATHRAWPSTPIPEIYGNPSTARRAGTRSTSSNPVKTMAGR